MAHEAITHFARFEPNAKPMRPVSARAYKLSCGTRLMEARL